MDLGPDTLLLSPTFLFSQGEDGEAGDPGPVGLAGRLVSWLT